MDVLIADLDETRPRLRQEFARCGKAIAQVAQIRVDAQLPGVSKRPDLLRFPRHIVDPPVLDLSASSCSLPVGAKADAVRRVDVDHLHLAAELLALRE